LKKKTILEKSKKRTASVKHGYYEDEALLKLFAREADSVDRKSPEIARGTWARVLGTRQELRSFYENNSNATIRRRKVVINCGAGFDTTHWWSKKEELFKAGDLWFDLDMEPVVRQRIRRLRMPGAKSLLSSLKNLKITDSQLSSDSYFIRKLDMKQSSSADVLEDIKSEFEIDEQTDVCLLFECVLVYMSTEVSGAFLKSAADLFNNLKVISYEQVYI
jgi:[phosphatase 2A protein]-leucine-carboxy methyltransferase